MSLEQILGTHLNGEGVAKLLNIAQISLSAAAANAEDAVQLGQVHSIRDAIQAQIDAIDADHKRISSVHVDTVSGTLAEALALADSHDSATGVYTFGVKHIGEGDSIILQAATDPAHRSWIHNGGLAGTDADFDHLNSDIEALINAGTQAVIDALRDGVPEEANTFKKVFDAVNILAGQISTAETNIGLNSDAIATLSTEVASKVRAFYLSGTFAKNIETNIMECSVGNPANHENARVTVKEALGGGSTRTLAHGNYVDTVSDTTILLQTLAPSYENKEVIIVVEH